MMVLSRTKAIMGLPIRPVCSAPSSQRAVALASSTISTISSHTATYGMCPGRRCSRWRSLHSASATTIASQVTKNMLTL